MDSFKHTKSTSMPREAADKIHQAAAEADAQVPTPGTLHHNLHAPPAAKHCSPSRIACKPSPGKGRLKHDLTDRESTDNARYGDVSVCVATGGR